MSIASRDSEPSLESLESLLASCDWYQRGHGGANVVVAPAGFTPTCAQGSQALPLFLQEGRFVLRLSVAPLSSSSCELFASLMCPYAMPIISIRLDPNSAAHQRIWSSARLPDSVSGQVALVLPDALSPIQRVVSGAEAYVTLEIKPKNGALPTRFLSKDPRAIGFHPSKVACCRFRMMQCVKRQRANSAPFALSRYCPVDFFSQEPQRVRRALRVLIENPQNNLKAYIGVSPSVPLSTLMEQMPWILDAAVEAVVRSKTVTMLRRVQSAALDVQLLNTLLGGGCKDITYVSCPAVSQVCVCHALDESMTREERNSVVEAQAMRILAQSLAVGKVEQKDASTALEEYFASVTANDCSLMLTLQPAHSASGVPCDCVCEGCELFQLSNPLTMCRVALIDTDSKTQKGLLHYLNQDEKILAAFVAL